MQRRVQARIEVTGDLHDTSFRTLLQRQAIKWQITGWVRFAPGGAQAIFNGRESDVDALARWCERGPLGPKVTKVVAERMGREAFSGFDVRTTLAPPEEEDEQEEDD